MKLSDFDYDLPQSYIAQTPAEPRDSSKLLHLNRTDASISHLIFRDIVDLLHVGDVLVMNNTRVIPARLSAYKVDTQGKAEVLLLHQLDDTQWKVLVGGRGIQQGKTLGFPETNITAVVIDVLDGAERIIQFSQPVNELLHQLGEMPLPPYIQTVLTDSERYQTVYSQPEGSAAAPTAGLHFTGDLLLALRDKGVKIANCTLHIGLDTFQPVKEDNIKDHKIHSEYATLDCEKCQAHQLSQTCWWTHHRRRDNFSANLRDSRNTQCGWQSSQARRIDGYLCLATCDCF